MKKNFLIMIILIAVFAISGCESNNVILNPAPAAPQGVYSITGDEAVYIYWNGPYEADLDEYVVMRSFKEFDNYVEIGRVDAVQNSNLDLLIYEFVDTKVSNGKTYFYAIRTIDLSGQSSDLSAEPVFDTPRPDGGVTLYPVSFDGSLSGFNLETETVVSFDSPAADFYLVYDDEIDIHFLTVGNTFIDVQDMGFTYNFEDIGFAPDTGWSSFVDMELILGHTYVLWTDNENYAKVRAIQKFPNSNAIKFEWAYQTVPNNRELKVLPPEENEETSQTIIFTSDGQ